MYCGSIADSRFGNRVPVPSTTCPAATGSNQVSWAPAAVAANVSSAASSVFMHAATQPAPRRM